MAEKRKVLNRVEAQERNIALFLRPGISFVPSNISSGQISFSLNRRGSSGLKVRSEHSVRITDPLYRQRVRDCWQLCQSISDWIIKDLNGDLSGLPQRLDATTIPEKVQERAAQYKVTTEQLDAVCAHVKERLKEFVARRQLKPSALRMNSIVAETLGVEDEASEELVA